MVGAELLAHLGEAEGEELHLQLGVDGRLAEGDQLGRRQPRVGELAVALGVGLLPLGRAPDEVARDAEQLRVVLVRRADPGGLPLQLQLGGGRLGDGVPRPAHVLLERGHLGHPGPERLLLLHLGGEEHRVEQRLTPAEHPLVRVLHAEQLVLAGAAGLGAALLVLRHPAAELGQPLEPQGQELVPERGQLRDRQKPARRSRVAGDEGQLAIACARRAPAEVLRGLQRLSVLVDAEEAHVEVVAGEVEVVRVPPEEGDGLLGREDQPDVLLPAAVRVEVVLAAAVQRDDLAAQLVRGLAGLLQPRELCLLGPVEGLSRRGRGWPPAPARSRP